MKKKLLILFVCILFSCSAHAGSANVEYKSDVPPVLIGGAMDIETEFLISNLEEPVNYKIGVWKYFAGKIDGYPVVISKTEQGMINAVAATVLGIETFKPIAIINQGTAGGHDPKLNRGDIILAEKTLNGSAWKSEYRSKGEGIDFKNFKMLGKDFFYDDSISRNSGDIYIYSDKNLLATAQSIKYPRSDTETEGDVVTGTISTQNSWESQVDKILFLHENFGSSAEEMETYSVASICQDYGVPFLGIRILSNSAPNNENFDPQTGIKCQEFVLEFLRKYIKNLK